MRSISIRRRERRSWRRHRRRSRRRNIKRAEATDGGGQETMFGEGLGGEAELGTEGGAQEAAQGEAAAGRRTAPETVAAARAEGAARSRSRETCYAHRLTLILHYTRCIFCCGILKITLP